MFIAKQLKDKNVCEYLLYMWQIEDTIRAFAADKEAIKEQYVSRFQYDEEQQRLEAQWLSDLTDMMRQEGVMQTGHLQMNKGTLILLTDRHNELLADEDERQYAAAYYRALPFIVELRAKARGQKDQATEEKPELEACFDALYGVMMLRLQKKEISKETETAIAHISHLLALLAQKYKQE